MKYFLADKMAKEMSREEVDGFLKEPNILRLGMIDKRDGKPLVHPVWFYYTEEKFFVATDKKGIKAESIRKNPDVYFVVDISHADKPPQGVRGKGTARIVDDTDFAVEVTRKNVLNYLGSVEGESAKKILETGKDSCTIVITPKHIGSWKY